MNYANLNEDKENNTMKAVLIVFGSLFAAILVALLFWGIPQYGLYAQGLKGEANLRQQEWERKILVQQATAERDSASLKAEAEVARAKGVAQANKIIAEGLKGNEEYLRYLWINNLEHVQGAQVIYVPTEAGLPILEANRLK